MILEPKKRIEVCHCFPIYLSWSDGTRCHDLSFLIVEFQASFFTLLFHLKRLFCFSLLFAIRVVSSAYLRLLIFLLAILIPACASSSLAFRKMYSAYKLNISLGGSACKESAYKAGDPSSIPGSGRSPGEGNGNSLQYSFLENLMDRGAWRSIPHRVARVRQAS